MTDWISASEALLRLEKSRAPEVARFELVNAAWQKLVDVRAYKFRKTSLSFPKSDDEIIRSSAAKSEWLDDAQFRYYGGEGVRGEIIEWAPFNTYEIGVFVKIDDGSWQRSDFSTKLRRIELKTDWRSGHFHYRSLVYSGQHFPDDEEPTGYQLREKDWFSVEFDGEAVERILNGSADLTEPAPTFRERQTKYDWEQALADVAARLYHELDFPNLDAIGVQKELADALRQSFVERRLPEPSDESLKNKARLLLGSLRGKRP